MVKFRLIAIFILTFISACLYAQEEVTPDSEIKTVRAIEINGLKNFKKEEIFPLLKTKISGIYNETDWASDKVTLLKLGYFKTVTTEEKIRIGFVRLVINLEEIEFNRKVKSIEVIGLKFISPSQIIANMRTQIGINFEQKVFDRDIVKLHAMSFSKDIKSSVVHLSDGYSIKVFLSEDIDWYDKYEVYMPKGLRGGVKKDMKEQILLGEEGDYLDETHIETVKRRIKEYFKTKGFYFVDVQTSVKLRGDKKILLFTINRGPKLKVGELIYNGNKKYPQNYLINAAPISVKPLGKYIKGNLFMEGAFAEDQARLSLFYQIRGYINAKIEVQPYLYNASKDRLYLTFNIDEGPRYYVGGIKFTGNNLVLEEDLYAVLKHLPGSPFNGRGINEDAKNIEGLYGEDGRLFTIVDPKFSFDTERHIVDITYSIKESDIIKIGKVIVNGNDVTKETVFLKELELYPGDVYDRYKFDRSKINIQRLPFVEYQEVKLEVVPSASGEDTGDLIIDIKEKQSGSLTFGVVFSELESLAGSIKISESNFNWQSLFGMASIRGGGQNIYAEAQVGVKNQTYNIGFTNPMIYDSPVYLSLNSYLRESNSVEFDSSQLGGTMSFGRKLFGDLSGSMGYRIENAKIYNLNSNVADIITNEPKDYVISALTLSLSYEKRNNFAMPFSGYFVSLSEEVAEGEVFGNRTYTKSSFELSAYFHTGDRSSSSMDKIDDLFQKKFPYYFAFHLESDVSFAYDDDSVPLTKRFFAGGSPTVRGFRSSRLAPRDAAGRLYPGNFRLVGNIEFNIPILNDTIYLAPFVDAGYVWDDVQRYKLDDIRVSTGVTLKIRLPVLGGQPILLSYGYPLVHKNGDQLKRFELNFVTAF